MALREVAVIALAKTTELIHHKESLNWSHSSDTRYNITTRESITLAHRQIDRKGRRHKSRELDTQYETRFDTVVFYAGRHVAACDGGR
ncbi:hypothetical protein TUM17383_01500 [Shewanella algae]|nr:hypothetical protein TUM17383_01500 [Shewanella algae]BCV56197.1 hypothetical protein TUM17384_01420 [Shewanella algae]